MNGGQDLLTASSATEGAAPRDAGYVPGLSLLRPAPLLAAVAIAFNLLYLKGAYPGLVSGKLSDFAICFFLPVVLSAIYEWAAFALGKRRPAGKAAHLVSCTVTALYFSALQLMPAFARLHEGLLQSMIGRRFAVTCDPTDLIALPMVAVAYLYLEREARRRLGPS